MVIDANRIFSALIAANGRLRRLLGDSTDHAFFCPKYVLVERISFFDEDAISIGSWTEAWRLCRDVDENDTACVALTLELGGELWTSDRELETGLRKKGFTRFFSPG